MQNVKVGDLVLVNDGTTLGHHCWPFAQVIHIIPDCFGWVWQIVVRKESPAEGEFERDICKLCILGGAT